MANNKLVLDEEVLSVVKEVKLVLEVARSNVARQVNSELLNTYWNIGRIICEHEQSNPERADYGKQTLKELAKELTKEFGKGFSVSNIQFMRRFYQTYQIQQTVSVKLSWSHYCELMSISDSDKRRFYECAGLSIIRLANALYEQRRGRYEFARPIKGCFASVRGLC